MRAAPSILSAAAASLLLACSDSTGPSGSTTGAGSPRPPEAISFQVSPATATLLSGQSLQFGTTYSGNPALSGGHVGVAWHSSNETVAAVSAGGLVRGIGVGRTTIVAVWGGYQASANIAVVGPMKKHDNPPVCQQATSGAGHPQC
jgi:hypothetical protein